MKIFIRSYIRRFALFSLILSLVSFTLLSSVPRSSEASVQPPQTNYSYDYSIWSNINWQDPLDEFLEDLLIIPEQEWIDDLSDITRQMSAVAMTAAGMVGTFFDASHQMHVQRLIDLEHLNARRRYQPSTALCRFGTLRSGLPSTEMRADLNSDILAVSAIQRDSQHLSRIKSDPSKELTSRLAAFRNRYCNQDYMGGSLAAQGDLEGICAPSVDPATMGKDINYTRTVGQPLTLTLNFTDTSLTGDEQDVRALMTNLYSYNLVPNIGESINKTANYDDFLEMRSLWAARSLARSAFINIVGHKSSGTGASDSFLKDIIRAMGLEDEDAILELYGDDPSYEAQMEILTKKLYQSPNFIVSLIDSPENVRRQNTAMLASKLMQDRDILEALHQRELLISAILNELLKPQENEFSKNRN